MCPHFSENWDLPDGEHSGDSYNVTGLTSYPSGCVPRDAWEQMWRLSAGLALLSWTWDVVAGKHLQNVSSQPLLPWCFHAHPLSLAFFLFVFSGVFCSVTCHKWMWWNAKCYTFSHIPKERKYISSRFSRSQNIAILCNVCLQKDFLS